MEDKIDYLIEMLGKNKKTLFIVIIAYVVITLGIIVAIWWPEAPDYATYNSINIEQNKRDMAQKYLNDLSIMFKTEDEKQVQELISSEYVNFVKKDRLQIISELKEEGYFSLYSDVKGMEVFVDGDTYVYTTAIYSKGNKKNISVIEKFPYKYEIVFDDFYGYKSYELIRTLSNVEFKINSVYSNLKYITYNVSITNYNDTYVLFNFNDSAGVQAILSDGTSYLMANNVSTEQYTKVDTGMTINKEFVFQIPVQLQHGIENILFNDVSVNLEKKDLRVILQ